MGPRERLAASADSMGDGKFDCKLRLCEHPAERRLPATTISRTADLVGKRHIIFREYCCLKGGVSTRSMIFLGNYDAPQRHVIKT